VSRAVGIDVGGTKIAAGLVDVETGGILERRQQPTRPERGGEAVLADCAALVTELGGGERGLAVGIGLCELVDLDGRPASADTIDWRGLDLEAAVDTRVVLESDVRAAARAEAVFGAGAGRSPFVFAIVGTGISVCLVVDGHAYAGSRGQAIVLGAPPVELVASGPALAEAAGVERAEDVLADPAHGELVDDVARALGGDLAALANALDPTVIVLGGGLGSAPAFRSRVEVSCRSLLAYPSSPPLEVVSSALGPDGGVVGAALRAVEGR
jgi:glucokinase